MNVPMNASPSEAEIAAHLRIMDPALRDAVPAGARMVLDAGCGEGWLGAAIKAARPGCAVVGLESDPAAILGAETRLDRVLELDIDRVAPPFEPRSFDTIICNHLLERTGDPLAALRRLVFLLNPGGVLLAATHNAQHHGVLAALLRGDMQYRSEGGRSEGALDHRNRHLFTYATLIKTMLDAGLLPRLLTLYLQRQDAAFSAAAEPLLRHFGVPPERAALYLGAHQYLFAGYPLNWGATPEEPMTFVVCSNSPDVLRDNLLSSPCLAPGTMHQVIVVDDARSAADGLNRGIEHARHPIVVGVHQDVYLPAGWPARFLDQYRQAERRFGRLGVAGVYGTRTVDGKAERFGRVVDRHSLLVEPPPLPAAVETLDELLLAVPRDTPLRFDPDYGFHFYGVDMACAARANGLVAAVLDAPCFHNSQFNDVLPQVFHDAAAVFRRKWAHLLPVATASDVVG